jgi:hypothetical protein
VTCDSTPIQFSAFAVDMCFTESSFSSDDSYYSYYYYYSSSTTSFKDTSSTSTSQKLVSKAMSKMKPYSSESVGTSYYYAPTIGPSEWSCYNPNKQDDDSYYYYGNSSYYSSGSTSSVTAKQQNRRKSRSLLASSNIYSCAPYAGKNTSSDSQNYTVCSYQYSGDKPVIITGTLLLLLHSQINLIL